MNTYKIDENPFAVTKANDLDNEEILTYWVHTPGGADDVAEYVRPRSATPMFVLGGKGCGKTHLLRYHSYDLQRLRWEQRGQTERVGILDDGYIGIYLLCGGIDTGRFAGKGQRAAQWDELFAYYVELWAAARLIATVDDSLWHEEYDREQLCREIIDLFDEPPDGKANSLSDLVKLITHIKKDLDLQINNCAFSGKLDVRVLATRGRLIFGIPRILSRTIDMFSDISFVYIVDELENLSESQQRLVNSLVRDRKLPATFRIGARRYGVKTHRTDASQEENIPDSEFEEVFLDDAFRRRKEAYRSFAKQLLGKRIVPIGEGRSRIARDLSLMFEIQNERWNSNLYMDIVDSVPSQERRHFRDLLDKLESAKVANAHQIIDELAVEKYPLIEKVNILLFFGALKSGHDALGEAKGIREECEIFLSEDGRGSRQNRVMRTLGHYRSDLVAQLRRENRVRNLYLGLENLVAMSGGLPRALLTTLRNIFDWSIYKGEDPLSLRGISIDAQYRGVSRASEWFFDVNVRKAGSDGRLVQSAADRLGQLFRTNRFADRPVECSLNSFSVAEHELSAESRRVLRLCEDRSLLNRVTNSQKHRNTKRIELKFQLHPMLCPRWQLPLGRRGVLPLSAEVADNIFDIRLDERFQEYLRRFRTARSFSNLGVNLQRTLF